MNAIKCDIAIMPIGGTYTMDTFAAVNACKEIRPKYAIPMMYGTTKRLSDDVGEFTRGLPESIRAIVLRPGASAKLP
jgi:L-ascorbate metabolism protein UlaG (beta-lactamase superfamily)